MRLSLIGMSNTGKTFWAKKLEEKGFVRFSCDDYIEKKLGVKDMAQWMGQPYDRQYKTASRKYLEFERESISYIIAEFKNLGYRNIVVDTTGSVVYTDKKLLQILTKQTLIVYLDTPESAKQQLYKAYLINPKPVIWGDSYQSRKGELPLQSLARCYAGLLDYRTQKYREYAHLTLNYFLLRSRDFTVDNLVNILFEQITREVEIY